MKRRYVLGAVLGLLSVLQYGSTEKLEECKQKGDYLWKKSSPNTFHFCYEEGEAVTMSCEEGRKMCKLPKKHFQPCMCNMDDNGIGNALSDCEEQKFLQTRNMRRMNLAAHPAVHNMQTCLDLCLQQVQCLSVDFNTDSRKCFVYTDAMNKDPSHGGYPLQRVIGVDHYSKRPCALMYAFKRRAVPAGTGPENMAPTTPNSTPSTPNATANAGTGHTQSTEGSSQKPTTEGPSHYKFDFEFPDKPEVGKEFPFPVPPEAIGAKNAQYSSPHVPHTTTTIPDSGCPYQLTKYEGMSHRGGVLLKSAKGLEACKSWCLNVGYCKAVDYDHSSGDCYYHRIVYHNEVTSAPNVWHIRKQHCTPPLKCWSHMSYNESNVDPTTHQIPCMGVCFVREKIFGTYSVFERGCHTSNLDDHKIGCHVDDSLTSMTCYCDTDRCNGLSIAALASMILHLPLDGDFKDHSGGGRDGQVALDYLSPQTTCLEKALNCSMLFKGNHCIEVPQMTSISFGDVDLENTFTPMMTLSLWYRYIPHHLHPELQGIVGNSWKHTVDPTWAIRTSNLSQNLVEAGILTKEGSPFEPDFKYIPAMSNLWHNLVMVYDGEYDVDNFKFPRLTVYLDGERVSGNEETHEGEILVRRQPTTVGCVAGKNFTGLIDDDLALIQSCIREMPSYGLSCLGD